MGPPIENWLLSQLKNWDVEPLWVQIQVKRLFIRALLHDLTSREFRQELQTIWKLHPKKVRIFTALWPFWIHSDVSNRYKLVLLSRRKPNKKTFKNFNFDPEPALIEFNNLYNRDIKKAIIEAQSKIIQPLNLESQNEIIKQVIQDLTPRLYNFSKRKLTFIVNSQRLTHKDFVQDLLQRVIENIRWYYPFKTSVHFRNSSYQAATNHGLNQIKYYIAQKRSRLIKDGSTGFISREIYDDPIISSLGDESGTEQEAEILEDVFYQDLIKSFPEGVQRKAAILFIGSEQESLVTDYLNWVSRIYKVKHPSIAKLIESDLHKEYLTEFLESDALQITMVRAILMRKARELRDL